VRPASTAAPPAGRRQAALAEGADVVIAGRARERLAQAAAEITRAVLFATRAEAMTGAVLHIDGGQRLV
jgi:NADP-dependent 3-hydroxy acid dehydrogenase YdfG